MRAVVKDVALWVLLSVPPVASGVLSHDWWTQSVTIIGIGIAVGLSRNLPGVALVIATAAVAGQLTVPMPFPPAIIVLSYLMGRRAARSWPALLCSIGLVAISAVVHPPNSVAPSLLTVLYTLVMPWLVGRYRRMQQELVLGGWQRAEQLEREQDILGDQARLRERSRIAEDMHDSLGHELSLLALRAGALELAPDLSERHRVAASELRASAAAATDRLRQVIGVLREESPAPTIPVHETVDEVVERAKASGMAVELRIEGETVDLAPMQDLAVHRVVQESLTNAAKHAPGSAVDVVVTHLPDEVIVTVTNDAPTSEPVAASGNYGLVGLRERVRLVGGTLTTGPHGEGFRVEAQVPRASSARTEEKSVSAERLRLARKRVRQGLIAAFVAPACIVGLIVIVAVVAAGWGPR